MMLINPYTLAIKQLSIGNNNAQQGFPSRTLAVLENQKWDGLALIAVLTSIALYRLLPHSNTG